MPDTKYRINAPEIMDDFDMEGEELRKALDKIAQINKLLGGNRLTLEGVRQLLSNIPKQEEITIADVGCGNGDMLRYLADFAENNSLKFKLIGIDANNFTVNYARKLSKHYPNISYECEDVLSKSFEAIKYDIILCTLTLHHFKNKEIIHLMSLFKKNSSIGIVINDLHRSNISYKLFQFICFALRQNRMSREDGLASILRGFKKQELIAFSEKLKLKKYDIQWKWAFRYQWIISKI